MDENQILIPDSFVDLYKKPGQTKLSEPRARLAERFELCDDMSRMLCEPASELLVKLGVAESDVLRKMLQGLLGEDAVLSELEALWVVCRVAELLSWPVTIGLASELSGDAAAWLERQFKPVV